jgi:hypothetical protein
VPAGRVVISVGLAGIVIITLLTLEPAAPVEVPVVSSADPALKFSSFSFSTSSLMAAAVRGSIFGRGVREAGVRAICTFVLPKRVSSAR